MPAKTKTVLAPAVETAIALTPAVAIAPAIGHDAAWRTLFGKKAVVDLQNKGWLRVTQMPSACPWRSYSKDAQAFTVLTKVQPKTLGEAVKALVDAGQQKNTYSAYKCLMYLYTWGSSGMHLEGMGYSPENAKTLYNMGQPNTPAEPVVRAKRKARA